MATKANLPNRAHKRRYVLARDGHRCLLCGSNEKLTLDHIVPRSMGGSNKVENLQTLCQNCNLKKGSNSRVDWRWLASCRAVAA